MAVKISGGKKGNTDMFRVWGKLWKQNKMLQNMTVTVEDESLNRTRKIFQALEEICYAYDLSKPLWLDKNIEEFKRHDKTRFSQDNFIDTIDFDYLEIQVLEE